MNVLNSKPQIQEILSFLRDYLITQVKEEKRSFKDEIYCDIGETNEAYCVTEVSAKNDDPRIFDYITNYDLTEYGEVVIAYFREDIDTTQLSVTLPLGDTNE